MAHLVPEVFIFASSRLSVAVSRIAEPELNARLVTPKDQTYVQWLDAAHLLHRRNPP